MMATNLFDDILAHAEGEFFTDLLSRENVRIERIVSTGQSTPVDQPSSTIPSFNALAERRIGQRGCGFRFGGIDNDLLMCRGDAVIIRKGSADAKSAERERKCCETDE